MSPVICPAYLPNIAYFSTISRSRNITLYIHGNYQKQTYRNRAQIYSPNGILDLSIPIIKPKNIIEKKDYNIKICYDENWQKKHWKTIKNSYSSSPFFEIDTLPIKRPLLSISFNKLLIFSFHNC